MWEYTDKVKEHFLNPRNVGEIENPDGVAEVGSLACGDALKLTFKLDENKKIKEAKFKTFGCASAIASSSALTEIIKGKTVEEALKVTNQDIAKYLGGLPDEKMHCSVMGKQALEKAVENYRGAPALEAGAKIICECFGVTDLEIERAVRENNLSTLEDVTNYTKAGGGCGLCHDAILQIIDRVRSEPKTDNKPKLTNIQKIRLIEETIGCPNDSPEAIPADNIVALAVGLPRASRPVMLPAPVMSWAAVPVDTVGCPNDSPDTIPAADI